MIGGAKFGKLESTKNGLLMGIGRRPTNNHYPTTLISLVSESWVIEGTESSP